MMQSFNPLFDQEPKFKLRDFWSPFHYQILYKFGTDTLTDDQLEEACLERGLPTNNKTQKEIRLQLQRWIQFFRECLQPTLDPTYTTFPDPHHVLSELEKMNCLLLAFYGVLSFVVDQREILVSSSVGK
eukprot:TRINITY_DN10048_c0_g1_i4.p2 TRINITY_DN10048_c0_g1~~TRINITY_DN10048_c0_g1_i4.p2  ORF type:complete len:129 (+),score=30.09 TRINITY_DN10048_c0_g1_i4:1109-1495(+)